MWVVKDKKKFHRANFSKQNYFFFWSDIATDNRITNNSIIGFTETQINPTDCIIKIMETFHFLNINFNNNENEFLCLAYGCGNDLPLLNKFDANGVSILSFKKHTIADRVFTLMLVHRKQAVHMLEFFQMLQ